MKCNVRYFTIMNNKMYSCNKKIVHLFFACVNHIYLIE